MACKARGVPSRRAATQTKRPRYAREETLARDAGAAAGHLSQRRRRDAGEDDTRPAPAPLSQRRPAGVHRPERGPRMGVASPDAGAGPGNPPVADAQRDPDLAGRHASRRRPAPTPAALPPSPTSPRSKPRPDLPSQAKGRRYLLFQREPIRMSRCLPEKDSFPKTLVSPKTSNCPFVPELVSLCKEELDSYPLSPRPPVYLPIYLVEVTRPLSFKNLSECVPISS